VGVSSSIDGDPGGGCCARDLRERISDADRIEAGRPEFKIERTAIGFAVRGNRIGFVDSEDVVDSQANVCVTAYN